MKAAVWGDAWGSTSRGVQEGGLGLAREKGRRQKGKGKEKEERKAYSNSNIFISFFEGNKTHPAEAVVPQSMTR